MSGEAFGLVKRGYKFHISREVLFPAALENELERIETPKTAEWLLMRNRFAAQFEGLVALGLKEGFLEQEACYECGGDLMVTTNLSDVTWEDTK